jgi:hypothetical protein
MSVVDDSFEHSLKLEEKAVAPLAGGILNHGFQCGMLWGASLAAGAEVYQRLGAGPQAETGAVLTTQKLVDKFRSRTGDKINCIDMIGLDMQNNTGALKFILKGGPIGCLRIIASYAPEAFNEIDSALSEEDFEALAPPVSCAAKAARAMGASDEHAVMAAGFAGGIGLSGGACGALGAAIWITAMNSSEEWPMEMGSTNPEGQEVIDRFVEASDCEFECCEIVGRMFENIGDHADYLRAGGCLDIIEALAAPAAG